MVKFKSFSTTKNKLEKLWNKNESNSSNINDYVKNVTITLNSYSFNKRIIKIPLIEKSPAIIVNEELPGALVYNVISNFTYFPEWAIPYTHIVPVLYTEDGAEVKITDTILDFNFSHLWKKINENVYDLDILVFGIGNTAPFQVQYFLDINLYFLNKRNFTTIDKSHV